MHVQGALRNSITAFVKVSPQLKDTVWSYLEQYDLPVVTVPPGQQTATQVPPKFTWNLLTHFNWHGLYLLLSDLSYNLSQSNTE
jgi:hypothetical protein